MNRQILQNILFLAAVLVLCIGGAASVTFAPPGGEGHSIERSACFAGLTAFFTAALVLVALRLDPQRKR